MTSSHPQAQRFPPELTSPGLNNPFDDPSLMPDEQRSGDICPCCREARLDYDGLLNLRCPKCGYALVGSFT
jgi:hypothetical protein